LPVSSGLWRREPPELPDDLRRGARALRSVGLAHPRPGEPVPALAGASRRRVPQRALARRARRLRDAARPDGPGGGVLGLPAGPRADERRAALGPDRPARVSGRPAGRVDVPDRTVAYSEEPPDPLRRPAQGEPRCPNDV